MKKIFILTGEPSGDKLASTVISKLKSQNSDIEYLSVGGNHLKKLGIESIFNLNEITYLGFTSILLNIFKIRNKINYTVNEIIKFNPDILFSVDSPDFTLRVAERVKKINTNIKTIHYVAPQVWIWRKNRVKKIKKFIDHILLLFDFEKKYFDEENIKWLNLLNPVYVYSNKQNLHNIVESKQVNYIKLSIYPDGGIARFKAYGIPIIDKTEESMEYASILNGGSVILSSDTYDGEMNNVIKLKTNIRSASESFLARGIAKSNLNVAIVAKTPTIPMYTESKP